VDTDQLSTPPAWPTVPASRQTTSGDSPVQAPDATVLLTDSWAIYVAAGYRLMSANIVRCHFLMNATRNRQITDHSTTNSHPPKSSISSLPTI
jgi:hypothetical protein